MTPERARLLEAVAEAAEILENGTYVIRGRTPEDADTYAHELEHIRHLMECTAALRAHDAAPQVVEETVEVRADVFRLRDGTYEVREHNYILLPHPLHIATITARVPLPVVPVIPATVEEVKR